MNIFHSLLIPFSLAAALLGCSEVDDKKPYATPDQTPPFIVAEDNDVSSVAINAQKRPLVMLGDRAAFAQGKTLALL